MTDAVDEPDAPGVKPTLLSLAALLALTALTTGLAFAPLGPIGHRVAALSIAAVKAGIVAAVFMHLGKEPRLLRTFALGGVGWLLVLFAGVISELLTRG